MLINVAGLTWGYPHQQPLFKDLHFELEKGDFCFVMGPSGSGKTTLIKILTRQITTPHKMVFYKDEDLSRLSDQEVQHYRRRVGIIFQDYKLIMDKTVEENILYPLEMHHVPHDIAQQKLDSVLERVHMTHKRKDKAYELSGGEKQKVAIARALITNPEFIIADEPTGNLDREAATMIADLLIEAHKAGNTILFITHSNQLVEYVKAKHDIRLFTM